MKQTKNPFHSIVLPAHVNITSHCIYIGFLGREGWKKQHKLQLLAQKTINIVVS